MHAKNTRLQPFPSFLLLLNLFSLKSASSKCVQCMANCKTVVVLADIIGPEIHIRHLVSPPMAIESTYGRTMMPHPLVNIMPSDFTVVLWYKVPDDPYAQRKGSLWKVVLCPRPITGSLHEIMACQCRWRHVTLYSAGTPCCVTSTSECPCHDDTMRDCTVRELD